VGGYNGMECRGGGNKLDDEKTGTITYDIASPNSTTEFYDIKNRKNKANEPDNYWNYGTVEFTSGACNEQKRIIKDFVQATGKIIISVPLSNIPNAGNSYTIKRGCNRSTYWCKVKMNNWINFGGFTGVPRNPEPYEE